MNNVQTIKKIHVAYVQVLYACILNSELLQCNSWNKRNIFFYDTQKWPILTPSKCNLYFFSKMKALCVSAPQSPN